MAGGDGGPCGCEVLGCGFDVGDAPGDDGVGEQSESFALDVLAVGVSAASLTSAISCSTDVATSRGYALELFGALSLHTLRVAITTAPVVPSTKTPTPLLPTPQHLQPIPAGISSPGCCVDPLRPQSKYSRDPSLARRFSGPPVPGSLTEWEPCGGSASRATGNGHPFRWRGSGGVRHGVG